MSKEADINFLKIQTCVLRVNIHCDGCKQKVRKLLQKIDGVYTTTIDSEQGKVTVTGDVDPATLVRKLTKSGKHAELWSVQKGGNNNSKQQQQQLNHQFQKMQIDNKKGQKDAKPPKGGGKDQKAVPLPQQMQQPQHLQHFEGLKDLKLPQFKGLKFPFKDQKSVKFSLPEDDDFSDEFDDYDDDDLDEFDDDFDDEGPIKPHSFKDIQMKTMNGQIPGHGHPLMNAGHGHPLMNAAAHAMNDKKGGGGGGGGGAGGNGNKNVQVPIKGGNNNDGKNNSGGKKGGGNNGGGNQNPNQNQNGGGKNGAKNGGGNNKNVPNMPNGGGGGGVHNPQGGKKGGGGPQKDMGQGFHEIDLKRNAGGAGGMMGGGTGPMGHAAMPPHGNIPAVQGLPMNAGGGYFQGAGPQMMPGNPYHQQQLMAQMMMQQQQQRQHAGFQPMTYARPPPSVAYAPYMPAHYYPPPTPEYAHYFSDENTNSCSVM